MERLIKTVRKYPCLWDVSHIQYRDNIVKDDAWELVAKDCGMKNGLEAKFHWKKLRDSHREALRRRRINSNVKKPWKFEEQMKFILGPQQEMNVETVEVNFQDTYYDEESYDEDANMGYDETLEVPYTSPYHTEADNKASVKILQDTRQRHVKQEEIRDTADTSQNQQDSLSILFESLCQKTRVLPKYLQLRVQREVFEAVLRAEEEALSVDPLSTVHSSSLNPQASSSFGPSSSTTN